MTVQNTPMEVEAMTGVSPEVLRNWRSRGFMDDLGTKLHNGRWVYSPRDTMTIWVMWQMSGVGMNNAAAMMGANIITWNILRDMNGFRYLRGVDAAARVNGAKVPNRYFVMYFDEEWKTFSDMEISRVEVGLPGGFILDQWRIAQAVPQGIVDMIEEAEG